MSKAKIIIVEDDAMTRRILVRMLSPLYNVSDFGNGEDAYRHFLDQGAQLVLTDMKMPKMDGMELLTRVKEASPDTVVIMITGFSSIDSAVTAIKHGAHDYIAKPFEPADVAHRLQRALREKRLEQKVEALNQERAIDSGRYHFVTANAEMLNVLELAKRVARTDSTVLIQGETGVGKELVARLIHQWSPRNEFPFVPVNCSALADGVVESELFGHEKGAFTGAVGHRIGYFEMADQGTLLLDEIGTANSNFQVKLLRALQDRSIYRVGSATAINVNVRVIASTNQNLRQEAEADLFRSDLYYRLSVMTLHIPPLRERKDDIPLLVEYFLSKYRHINPRVVDIDAAGLTALNAYNFPGNVRELENIIERAMILERGRTLSSESLFIDSRHVSPPEEPTATMPPGENLPIREAEKQHILKVLEKCNGKKLLAAEMLGINKTTLWRKMKKYGLDG
ncbi:two component, sigma54 specific, transcriptional regulator, Fis family [Desulfuromusa kysingii]|uniref:Two component, sigma54 specific, transcriptional regulator, Fis family n=1 Tax=Desulfuromusa kysingii TaxID=37625 RepID=A0A1H4BEI3_9BACT|nr:sigma-54 dependent transcriptional regulator [Desulfuromusa kysingii]SEA46398.1 two component, sigma54 specific, transcriptional regulator, Fis family [Desulfuromusa kysingii]